MEKDLTIEVKQEEKKSSSLDSISKVFILMESIPKVLAGLLLILSMVAGYGALKPEEQAVETTNELVQLERRLFELEIERRVYNNLIVRILGSQGLLHKTETEAFLIEVPSGKVTRIKE